jgi:CRP/FNR family cyclic AMP-dependent transcriptional regulator
MDAFGEMFKRFSKTYQKASIIFCEYEPGDNFFLIQSGRVQIVKILGDIEKTLDVLKPGEIFGEMAILEEAPRSATAIAMDKVEVLEFNRANFEVLMRGNPQIALKLLKLFARRIYDQRRRLMILTLEEIDAKVADVFLMLAEKEPNKSGDSDTMEFKTTVDDLAHWAAIPVADCRTVLNHFIQQRRIELYADRIVIKNMESFQRMVNSRRKSKP